LTSPFFAELQFVSLVPRRFAVWKVFVAPSHSPTASRYQPPCLVPVAIHCPNALAAAVWISKPSSNLNTGHPPGRLAVARLPADPGAH
jgi:hypothetical protein